MSNTVSTLIGIVVSVTLFILGLVIARNNGKRKTAKTKIKGNNNISNQNIDITDHHIDKNGDLS